VIKISFSGETISVLDEMKAFINSFNLGSTGQSPVLMVGATGFEPEPAPQNTGPLPVSKPTPKLNTNIKSRAGRPPMSEEEKMQAKAIRTQKLLEEMAEAKADLNKQTPPAILDIEDAPKITKEALSIEIKKLSDTKGVKKVLEIYKDFGVSRLGEVSEVRYQELMAVVQASL